MESQLRPHPGLKRALSTVAAVDSGRLAATIRHLEAIPGGKIENILRAKVLRAILREGGYKEAPQIRRKF